MPVPETRPRRIAGPVSAILAGLLLACPAVAGPGRGPHPGAPRDPLAPMLRRIDHFLQRHETDGVVLDSRYVLNASEAARLSVVPQLLAYEELHKVHPSGRLRRDIADRADYLIEHFDTMRSGSVFDGMLGYAFLEAYEATGDPRYLAQGERVVADLRAIRRSEYVLNGGLMAAMAFAKHHRLTGDAESGDLARLVLAGLPAYQHPDGSFPHWCPGSRDVHYTDWMATELILIQEQLDDPLIGPMLQKMLGFMERRVDGRGVTSYEEPCEAYPGCTTYYYSTASGCGVDVDTRAFTNELGYSALLFDRFRSPRYRAVMGFLGSLESGGTFPDKWDYWPPPTDPYYPWTTADTSVVNTSLIFWSLASTLRGRHDASFDPVAWEPDLDADERPPAEAGPPVPLTRIESVAPNPSRHGVTVRFVLATRGGTRLEVFDVGGRRVRTLVSDVLDPGRHGVHWNRHDDAGHPCASGVYLVRLDVDGAAWTARVLVTR